MKDTLKECIVPFAAQHMVYSSISYNCWLTEARKDQIILYFTENKKDEREFLLQHLHQTNTQI